MACYEYSQFKKENNIHFLLETSVKKERLLPSGAEMLCVCQLGGNAITHIQQYIMGMGGDRIAHACIRVTKHSNTALVFTAPAIKCSDGEGNIRWTPHMREYDII